MSRRPEEDQRHIDRVYARLDELREHVAAQLAAVRRSRASGSPQNRSERDAFAAFYEDQLARLWSVEERLAFGRLDLTDGARRYIGRLGLADEERGRLLVDWRAPAAAAFYRATPADPGEVVRRRHLATRERTVVGVEDEVFDLTALGSAERATLSGEAALLAAVGASRPGRMGDIVATIQAEQDRVIRSEVDGVLVVQGGPGTGKTAVALHRAAYLLYTHRERLARSGVLVVGPSDVFLRYIEAVLPSLGETGVVMVTPGELFPGVTATGAEPAEVAALKGDPRMAGVVAAAVRARQKVPERPVALEVDGQRLVLAPEAVAAARERARRSRKPHNEARVVFVRDLLTHLSGVMARSLGTTLDTLDPGRLEADLRESSDVRFALNRAWLPATPQQLLSALYADPARLAAAAPHLTEAERRLLRRDRDAPWTPADVPLLDEAAELLGEDDSAARAAARRADQERAGEREYAREALRATGGIARDLVTAEALADRFADGGPALTVAERAREDRTWAYGHVVVDEAQELSPMMWRLLMRRCPSRSMTVVGDVAQAGSLAAPGSWEQALTPFVGDRWRLAELTINYRTPAQIMAAAARVLAAAGVPARAPESVREGEWPPQVRPVCAGDAAVLADAVRPEVAYVGDGRLAVVVSRRDRDFIGATLAAALPGQTGTGRAGLDTTVAVLTVGEVKGLEFDGVVLVEPAAIVEESPRGVHDLYVALTRPTQRLLVLHSRPLPPGLVPELVG